MRKTKIVCTIGPASESIDTLVQLIESGMNVARLNFSHGTYDEHENRINNIKEAARLTNKTVGILMDTKGPEIRTGLFETGAAEIVKGQTISIMMQETLGTSERFSVSYEQLINDVEVGSSILIDDGLIELKVVDINQANGEIIAKALNSGVVKDRKGVNVPNVRINLPGMTEKDAADILFGVEHGVDFIAVSFIRRQSDVIEVRELLEEQEATNIHIISKIENREG